uniref:Uncharacterized protein n=1 Tax=uncultured Armatimonadetes bacterium TaxID=157466 RepID=A0A6J4JNC7_9BACT|nr:hypothetical protein AVDCRST_MAG63-3731 [uncultured Armatimonadetes bacterium]
MPVVPDTRRSTTLGWRFARAVGVSLLLAPVCCFWAQDQAVDRIFSLMVPPVVLTLVLLLVNVPLRRFAPRAAFSEAELVVFYGMQAVICAMASEWMDVINPYIHSYALFADRNPRYETKILPYVSEWLFFKSGEGMEGFLAGGKPFRYFWSQLPLWWPKIIAWTVIAGLVCLAMLCVNALMADQWTNHEKLAFPLVQLPLAIIEGGGSSPFWRSRLMWGSFAVMFAIDMLNGFAFLYPWLPSLNVRFLGDLSTWFRSPPWNQVGWTPIGIFPFVSAIGFFMPTDLLFSAVFFFFVRKAQQVIAYSLGYEQGVFGGGGLVPGPPYFSEQSWGAFLGLFVTAVWVARGYLRNAWRQIWEGGGRSDARRVPPRLAFAGLVLSLLTLGAVGVGVGLRFGFVICYVLLFLAFSIAMTRLRAQLGPPTHEMAFMGPNQLIVDFRGTQGWTPDMIARTVTTFHFLNRIHRTHPMPHQLEAMYLAERSQLSQRPVFLALLVATIAGSVLGHLVRIYLGYRYTPGDAGGDTANVVAMLTDTPRAPNATAMLSVGIGLAVVLLLDFVRFRVPGFPLHPAGYALGMNFGVDYYWFGLLIVLAIKFFVQRYYGLGGYGKLRMIALGVILAEFTAEAIWATFSMLNERHLTYTISINGKMGWQQ